MRTLDRRLRVDSIVIPVPSKNSIVVARRTEIRYSWLLEAKAAVRKVLDRGNWERGAGVGAMVS